MGKKVTLLELIKNKDKYRADKEYTEDVFIERLEGDITIKKPSRALCLEGADLADDINGKSDVHMVYNCCVEPNLKDKELQQAYDCKEPDEIVEKIFTPGEISQISRILFEIAGYSSGVERVKDLKN